MIHALQIKSMCLCIGYISYLSLCSLIASKWLIWLQQNIYS